MFTLAALLLAPQAHAFNWPTLDLDNGLIEVTAPARFDVPLVFIDSPDTKAWLDGFDVPLIFIDTDYAATDTDSREEFSIASAPSKGFSNPLIAVDSPTTRSDETIVHMGDPSALFDVPLIFIGLPGGEIVAITLNPKTEAFEVGGVDQAPTNAAVIMLDASRAYSKSPIVDLDGVTWTVDDLTSIRPERHY
jgi:hypothetical protein